MVEDGVQFAIGKNDLLTKAYPSILHPTTTYEH